MHKKFADVWVAGTAYDYGHNGVRRKRHSNAERFGAWVGVGFTWFIQFLIALFLVFLYVVFIVTFGLTGMWLTFLTLFLIAAWYMSKALRVKDDKKA